MLRDVKDSERITEFYEYIKDDKVKEAFALLIGILTCIKEAAWRVSPQKKVRSIAVDLNGAWCFSIMPSKKRLTFQWRPPVIKMKLYDKEKLKLQFPESFTDDSHKDNDEHWAVKVESYDDASQILRMLNLH
jgi:hypothetical protein